MWVRRTPSLRLFKVSLSWVLRHGILSFCWLYQRCDLVSVTGYSGFVHPILKRLAFKVSFIDDSPSCT